MLYLAANKVSDDILKSLSMQRLPEEIQPILLMSSESLNKRAQKADQIQTRYNEIAGHFNNFNGVQHQKYNIWNPN